MRIDIAKFTDVDHVLQQVQSVAAKVQHVARQEGQIVAFLRERRVRAYAAGAEADGWIEREPQNVVGCYTGAASCADIAADLRAMVGA